MYHFPRYRTWFSLTPTVRTVPSWKVNSYQVSGSPSSFTGNLTASMAATSAALTISSCSMRNLCSPFWITSAETRSVRLGSVCARGRPCMKKKASSVREAAITTGRKNLPTLLHPFCCCCLPYSIRSSSFPTGYFTGSIAQAGSQKQSLPHFLPVNARPPWDGRAAIPPYP